MKQTATIEIEIPKGHQWSVADLQKAIQKLGIKCKITAVLNHIEIPKGLIKPRTK